MEPRLHSSNEPRAAAVPDLAPKASEIALSTEVVRLALRTSLLVGSVLNLINQGDALLGDAPVSVFKLALTYVVPYCVATYSATSITLRQEAARTQKR